MTKTIALSSEGVMSKTAACALYDGEARRMEVTDLAELGALIVRLEAHQALSYGVCELEQARVVTQELLPRTPGAIARDRDHFSFRHGPGFMMFDYDPMGEPLSPEEVLARFREVFPEAAQVAIMWRPSASSCIHNAQTGVEVRAVCGLRIWLPVSDASSIPALGEVLVTRLWARGLASFIISKSGQLLDRPLFDASVWQPERIDFVAGAICEAPLEQCLPPPEIIAGARDVFDVSTLPVLTLDERVAAANNREAARLRLAPNSREVRKVWVAERGRDLAKRRSIDPSVAEAVLRNAVEESFLGPDFPLLSVQYGEVSVADVLAETDKFDSTRFADPLEPDYRDDPRVAYVNLKGDAPYLYSHAHGGQRYVLSATGTAPTDIVDQLNERFAVVTMGKNAYVVRRGASERGIEIDFLTPAAFSTLMRNRPRTDGGEGHLGTQWLCHPRRKEYAGVEFNPGGGTPDYLNFFRGFTMAPKAGNTVKYWTFVREVICDGNEEVYRYVRRWLAHLIQKPAELPGVALVMRGAQGTGKNTFVEPIGRLLKPYFIELHSMEQVTGRFNGHFKNVLLAHANEAIWGGTKQQVGALKGMITDPDRAIEQKGVDIYRVQNYLRLVVSSNEEWAVPADRDDRRFVFLDVSAAHANDREYFAAIHAELENGGYEALMHDLMTEDLTGFIPAQRPHTGFGFDIKLRTAETIVRWVHDALDCGGIRKALDSGGARVWPESLEKVEFYDSYHFFFRFTETRRPEAEATFHKRLKEILPSIEERRPRTEKPSRQCMALPARLMLLGSEPDKRVAPPRPRVYVLPSLEEARKDFEKFMRSEGMVPWEPIDREAALGAVPGAQQTKVVQVVQPGQAKKPIR